MSRGKRLEQIQTDIGKHRKAVIRVLEEVTARYSPNLSDHEKAKLLDQFMYVKAQMDTEHDNAVFARNQRHSAMVLQSKTRTNP